MSDEDFLIQQYANVIVSPAALSDTDVFLQSSPVLLYSIHREARSEGDSQKACNMTKVSLPGRYEQQLAEEELEKLEDEEARKRREAESAKYQPNAMAQLEAEQPATKVS